MILLALLLACGDPNREPLTEGPLAWEPCALRFDDKGPPAQCATTDMPLFWDDPEGATVELFAERRLADDGQRLLWMLPGGPGQSAAVYEAYVAGLMRALPDTDVYLYEHRGVGRSSRLSCPEEEALDSPGGIDVTLDEWPSCLDTVQQTWDLSAFTSAAAADDLAEWIRLTADGRPVYVYGGSYGTTLAHRFLQRHPDLVDGVILDSLALDVDHRVYDTEFDAVARGVLDACAADDRCVEALGPDPEATAVDVVARVDQGHCADAIDGATLRRGVAAFAADASLRGFAPALFHRADRCTEDDVDEIGRLRSLFEDRPPHYTEELYSPVLFANIELSEQWPEPWPDLAELEAADAATLFSFGLGPQQRPLLDLWPRYAYEAAPLATTATPILMLQGGLDPLTPPWRADGAEAWFTGPGQHMVRFPEGTHVLLGATPAPGGDCATGLIAAFVEDPMATPDAACVDEIDPIRFDGQAFTSWLLFGDCGRYGDGCGGGRAAVFLAFLGLWRRRGCDALRQRGATRPVGG